MDDRIPSPGKAGRMLITPEDGSPAFYATVTMADEPTQEGSPLSKATLLSDPTAAKFGFGSSAVPNDVLGWLGNYNQHWWRKTYGAATFGYKEEQSNIVEAVDVYSGSARNYYCSDSITIDQATGKISLNNPFVLNLGGSENNFSWPLPATAQSVCNQMLGKYVGSFAGDDTGENSYTQVYYVAPDAYFWISIDNDIGVVYQIRAGGERNGEPYADDIKRVTTRLYNIPAGAMEYIHSSDRSAYPDSGEVDGVVYEYLGVPFGKFPTLPQIAIGSYVGTGEYGEDYYTELAVGFNPKFVYIAAEEDAKFYDTSGIESLGFFLWVEGMTQARMYHYNVTTVLNAEVCGGVFRFRQHYANDTGMAQAQMDGINREGVTYRWFALGF